MTIRIYIVDDHQFILDSLPMYFANSKEIEVVGTAATQAGCLHDMEAIRPDVFFIDFNLGKETSLYLIRNIKTKLSKSCILGYSGIQDGIIVKQMLMAGASGFVEKSASITEITKAIKEVASGRIYTSEATADKLLEADTCETTIADLSAQEKLLFEGILKGHKKVDIAKELEVTPTTIQVYKTRLYKKLKVKTDIDLFLYALRHKLLPDSY